MLTLFNGDAKCHLVTLMVSNLPRVLRLWYGKDDEELSYSELLTRKNYDEKLSVISKRQFFRYLKSLCEMELLKKKTDLNRHTCYSRTEKAKQKSFFILLSDFAELSGFHENRDPFGASIVYSQPALAGFMTEEKIEELYAILDMANAQIIDEIMERLIRKRISELPTNERENIVWFSKTIKIFDEMTRRLEKSGAVKTKKENKRVYTELLERAERQGFRSVQKLRTKVGWRFHRMFRHCPLTFEEQKEYQNLKKRLQRARAEEFFARIENEMPRVFCCFYNFEMEEFLLSKLDLVLCLDAVIRPVDEVLVSLTKKQLADYKVKIEKTLRSSTLRPPEWTGNNYNLQPVMRWSWDKITERKYLQRILIKVEEKL